MSKELAALVAKTAHKGQKYGTQDYFTTHVQNVVELCRTLVPIGNPTAREQMLIVAYLHDILEDTDVTLKDLKVAFGYDVAMAVNLLTKKEELNYDDYIEAIRMDPTARCVKIADTISNLNASLRGDDKKRVIKYTSQLALLTEENSDDN